MKQISLQLSEETIKQIKALAERWGEPETRHNTIVIVRCIERVYGEWRNSMSETKEITWAEMPEIANKILKKGPAGGEYQEFREVDIKDREEKLFYEACPMPQLINLPYIPKGQNANARGFYTEFLERIKKGDHF